MEREHFKGTRKQALNSAQAIFNQARVLYEATPPEGKEPFISEDQRLSWALDTLNLPSNLEEAISTTVEKETQAREAPKAARPNRGTSWNW